MYSAIHYWAFCCFVARMKSRPMLKHWLLTCVQNSPHCPFKTSSASFLCHLSSVHILFIVCKIPFFHILIGARSFYFWWDPVIRLYVPLIYNWLIKGTARKDEILFLKCKEIDTTVRNFMDTYKADFRCSRVGPVYKEVFMGLSWSQNTTKRGRQRNGIADALIVQYFTTGQRDLWYWLVNDILRSSSSIKPHIPCGSIIVLHVLSNIVPICYI